MSKLVRKCKACSVSFEPNSGAQKYCSEEHSNEPYIFYEAMVRMCKEVRAELKSRN